MAPGPDRQRARADRQRRHRRRALLRPALPVSRTRPRPAAAALSGALRARACRRHRPAAPVTVFAGTPGSFDAVDARHVRRRCRARIQRDRHVPRRRRAAGATTGDNAYQGAAFSLDLGWIAVARGDAPVGRRAAARSASARAAAARAGRGPRRTRRPPQSSGGACARKRRKPVKIRLRARRCARAGRDRARQRQDQEAREAARTGTSSSCGGCRQAPHPDRRPRARRERPRLHQQAALPRLQGKPVRSAERARLAQS